MADNKINSVKLGALVLTGLFLFILTLYIIGKNENLFGSNFEVRARFENVNGLMNGNNIRFSGIQAGTVKNIRIIDDTTIEVTMLIDDNMKPFIRKNALASIGTEGLIGNKIVNIVPAKGAAPPVQPGDLLSVRKIVSTDDMLQTLNRTNNNIADISDELKGTVHRINSSTTLWSILNEPSLAGNLKRSLSHISQASSNADDITRNLRDIIGDIKDGKGSVGILLRDTGFAAQLGLAVEKIRQTGEKAGETVDQLNRTVQSIREEVDSGKGTVTALLKDPAWTRKLNVSLDNVQKGTDAFNQDMEALKHNFLLRGYFRKLEKQQKKTDSSQSKIIRYE